MSNKCWLLLEKSDETRVSHGIDRYRDYTGERYHYDSFVPNYKNLGSGDLVVLRKENAVLGIGTVAQISEKDGVKRHRRCPECNSTDIRERRVKLPQWKCGSCRHEFSEPTESRDKIRSYMAKIEGFTRLNCPPSVKEVKQCAMGGDGTLSQLSILQLDAVRVRTLLEGSGIRSSPRGPAEGTGGQGFGLSQAERQAVDRRAMQIARKLYENDGWTVVDKSLSHSFDLLATRDEDRRYIRVRGTTGEGCSIILTDGEVQHVRRNKKNSALVIVARIHLETTGSGWAASSGNTSTHEDPWIIRDSELMPTAFRYDVL